MSKIRVLNEETINQIAAGEVIENPASVVKELVENAIDAGASRLQIEIKGGGFQLIRVTDDGRGMDTDDALLCFERHATSKIAKIEDLFALHSMGFRGEALASIAAIARVDLTTAAQEGQGVHLQITGGKMGPLSPAPRTRGTTFEVRSLFFNVPARKKFQKSAAASSAEIHRLVIQLALAHPSIAFELISNEESLLQVKSGTLEERITDLFQESFLKEKIPIEAEELGYKIQGFLGKSHDHRINRTGQYLFVNGRPIFSPQISRAVKEGFGERLGSDRYPTFVLHVEVPAPLVDVNVHPQKKEVRFQEGEFVRQFFQRAVQKVLAPLPSPTPQPIFSMPTLTAIEEFPLRFREEPPSHPTFEMEENAIGVFEHYLLLEDHDGIAFVDLKRAQEELIWKQLSENENPAQGLLFPLTIELSPVETQELSAKEAHLAKLGFSVHQGGKQSVIVEAIPPFLDETDTQEALRLILESDEEFSVLSKHMTRFAMRRPKKFSLHEALGIWNRVKLLNFQNAVARIETHEIENLFNPSSKSQKKI